MEVSYLKTNTLVDKTSDPLYIFIWEGPVWWDQNKAVWTITRVEKSTGNSVIWLRSEITKDRELNKWTSRLELIY